MTPRSPTSPPASFSFEHHLPPIGLTSQNYLESFPSRPHTSSGAIVAVAAPVTSHSRRFSETTSDRSSHGLGVPTQLRSRRATMNSAEAPWNNNADPSTSRSTGSHSMAAFDLALFKMASPDSVFAPSPFDSSSSSEADDSADGTYSTSVEVESQYPSPAFTSYSPSALHETMSDLEAILANDPLRTAEILERQQVASQQQQQVVDTLPDVGFSFDDFTNHVQATSPFPIASTSMSIQSPALPAFHAAMFDREPAHTSTKVPRPPTLRIPTSLPTAQVALPFEMSDFEFPAAYADLNRQPHFPPWVPESQTPGSRSRSNTLPSRRSIIMPSVNSPASTNNGGLTAPMRGSVSRSHSVSYASTQLFSPYFNASPLPANGLGLHEDLVGAELERSLFEAYLKKTTPVCASASAPNGIAPGLALYLPTYAVGPVMTSEGVLDEGWSNGGMGMGMDWEGKDLGGELFV